MISKDPESLNYNILQDSIPDADYQIEKYTGIVSWEYLEKHFLNDSIIPFWINELLRSFALRILFANEGVINNVLTGIGILDQGILFITYDVGLYTGLIYAYILLMMFPLYNAIESLDVNQKSFYAFSKNDA